MWWKYSKTQSSSRNHNLFARSCYGYTLFYKIAVYIFLLYRNSTMFNKMKFIFPVHFQFYNANCIRWKITRRLKLRHAMISKYTLYYINQSCANYSRELMLITSNIRVNMGLDCAIKTIITLVIELYYLKNIM